MITIEQLLASVDLDLDFDPRWVTNAKDRCVCIWERKPSQIDGYYWDAPGECYSFAGLKVSEFDGKDWTECIYEVPRKTTGKIEKLGKLNVSGTNMTMNQNTVDTVVNALNQVIDAVNELRGDKHPISNPQVKGAKNE